MNTMLWILLLFATAGGLAYLSTRRKAWKEIKRVRDLYSLINEEGQERKGTHYDA